MFVAQVPLLPVQLHADPSIMAPRARERGLPISPSTLSRGVQRYRQSFAGPSTPVCEQMRQVYPNLTLDAPDVLSNKNFFLSCGDAGTPGSISATTQASSGHRTPMSSHSSCSHSDDEFHRELCDSRVSTSKCSRLLRMPPEVSSGRTTLLSSLSSCSHSEDELYREICESRVAVSDCTQLLRMLPKVPSGRRTLPSSLSSCSHSDSELYRDLRESRVAVSDCTQLLRMLPELSAGHGTPMTSLSSCSHHDIELYRKLRETRVAVADCSRFLRMHLVLLEKDQSIQCLEQRVRELESAQQSSDVQVRARPGPKVCADSPVELGSTTEAHLVLQARIDMESELDAVCAKSEVLLQQLAAVG